MHWFLGIIAVGEMRRHVAKREMWLTSPPPFILVLDSLLHSVSSVRKQQALHLQLLLR